MEWRPRKFIKTLHGIKNTTEENNLHRSKKLIDVDKKLSYKILNAKSSDSITTYETFKEVKRKMFKFKLMINELPVIENLKK